MVTNVSYKDMESNEIIYLAERHLLKLTARQLWLFALPAQLSGLLSCLLAGNCPGSKLVWRNICKVWCGWFRDRGI